ncbi:ATP-grasp domain-containing protein [uncultured Lacinutrix sp.]|uniref:ATP-grasp domain-containing protein n=1 Tax=uncultured Lacinutrix sp. TaxID=574032 RepID=UPI002629D20D|nr:ATP-grasp domain-containing protein [uncultured Lacinutrix sp.]
MNILFTCAGRRNYLINYFKKALKGNGKVFAADMQATAPALIDADVAIIAPSIYDDSYIDFLKQTIEENNIKAIISLNDLELPILSKNKETLEVLGAKVIVSNPNAINIAFDKWETVKFLENNNLKTPKTFIELSLAKTALKNGSLKFPVVVKPRWGSASIAVDFAEDEEELDLVYKLQTNKLKKSILAKASKDDLDRAILIQEKIKGVEYGMDVLNDLEGNYYNSFVREKLSMRSGETDKAISVINSDLSNIGSTIGSQLKHIGNLDCDVFYDGKDFYVLELNPRFGGGYPFSHEAGVNTPAIYLDWLSGETNIDKHNKYKDGIAFAKCDRLLDITKGL